MAAYLGQRSAAEFVVDTVAKGLDRNVRSKILRKFSPQIDHLPPYTVGHSPAFKQMILVCEAALAHQKVRDARAAEFRQDMKSLARFLNIITAARIYLEVVE